MSNYKFLELEFLVVCYFLILLRNNNTYPVILPLYNLNKDRRPGLQVLGKRLQHITSFVEVYQNTVLFQCGEAFGDLEGRSLEFLPDERVVGGRERNDFCSTGF